MNKAGGQLGAAHLILGYTPPSFAFQAPKYVIRARDLRLRRISVTYQGFVVLEGVPLPKGAPRTQPLFVATPSVEASSSQLILREEEDRRGEEEEVVDLTDSSNEFEVFNQTIHSEDEFRRNGCPTKTPKEFNGANREPAWERCTEEICTVSDSPSSHQISSSYSSPASSPISAG